MDYNQLASKESVAKTVAALTANGLIPQVVESKEQALEEIKKLIPQGVSIMNGSSTTLQQIGYVDYLKAEQHGWLNLHEAILKETDKEKQVLLRKESAMADFYLGSAHAVTETGELVIASASGSQLPALAFDAKNIILVVGTQKVVPSVTDAMHRLETYVFPLEDKRMKDAGQGGSLIAKILIFAKEAAWTGRKVHVLLVNEVLGF